LTRKLIGTHPDPGTEETRWGSNKNKKKKN